MWKCLHSGWLPLEITDCVKQTYNQTKTTFVRSHCTYTQTKVKCTSELTFSRDLAMGFPLLLMGLMQLNFMRAAVKMAPLATKFQL